MEYFTVRYDYHVWEVAASRATQLMERGLLVPSISSPNELRLAPGRQYTGAEVAELCA